MGGMHFHVKNKVGEAIANAHIHIVEQGVFNYEWDLYTDIGGNVWHTPTVGFIPETFTFWVNAAGYLESSGEYALCWWDTKDYDVALLKILDSGEIESGTVDTGALIQQYWNAYSFYIILIIVVIVAAIIFFYLRKRR